jgi:hypothetical protein
MEASGIETTFSRFFTNLIGLATNAMSQIIDQYVPLRFHNERSGCQAIHLVKKAVTF